MKTFTECARSPVGDMGEKNNNDTSNLQFGFIIGSFFFHEKR